MKALTICQPYAHLIAIGEKWVENRRWWTSYRGPLAIHAGKSRQWLEDGDLERYPNMAFGAIVAIANVINCAALETIRRQAKFGRSPWVRLWEHEHTEGPWCWILADVVRLGEPIAIPGKRRLWNVPEDVAQVLERLWETNPTVAG